MNEFKNKRLPSLGILCSLDTEVFKKKREQYLKQIQKNNKREPKYASQLIISLRRLIKEKLFCDIDMTEDFKNFESGHSPDESKETYRPLILKDIKEQQETCIKKMDILNLFIKDIEKII